MLNEIIVRLPDSIKSSYFGTHLVSSDLIYDTTIGEGLDVINNGINQRLQALETITPDIDEKLDYFKEPGTTDELNSISNIKFGTIAFDKTKCGLMQYVNNNWDYVGNLGFDIGGTSEDVPPITDNYVSFSLQEGKTEEQKKQARTNIGAIGSQQLQDVFVKRTGGTNIKDTLDGLENRANAEAAAVRSANSAAQSLTTIQEAISNLDLTLSSEDAIIALTAQFAENKASIESIESDVELNTMVRREIADINSYPNLLNPDDIEFNDFFGTSNSSYFTSGFINVSDYLSSLFTISKGDSRIDIRELRYYDDGKNYLGSMEYISNSSAFSLDTTTYPTTAYIKISLLQSVTGSDISSIVINKVQLCPTSTIQPYGYGKYVSLKSIDGGNLLKNSISIDKTDFIITQCGKNLINPEELTFGLFISYNGSLVDNPNYNVTGFIEIPEDAEYIVVSVDGSAQHYNTSQAYYIFYDSDKITSRGLYQYSQDGASIRIPQGAKYARFSIYSTLDKNQVEISETGQASEYEDFYVKNTLVNQSPMIVNTSNIVDKAVTKEKTNFIVVKPGKNLYNPNSENVVTGRYIYSGNTFLPNENYNITDYIPLTQEIGSLVASVSGAGYNTSACVGYYDSNYDIITTVLMSNSVATWQLNVAYVRFTIPNSEYAQVEVGTQPTEFEEYAERYVLDGVSVDSNTDVELLQVKSLLGNDGLQLTSNSLASNTVLEMTNFPRHIKKGICMSFHAKFNNFTSLTIGKGRNQYRGAYFVIDNTNIVLKRYESSEFSVETITHNLTMSTFINVSIYMDDYGKFLVIVQTLNGYYKHVFDGTTEMNYNPFVIGENSFTDVVFNATCKDFKCPVWVFGDSYLGIDNSRWPGVMKNFGFFNILLDGLAGQTSGLAFNDLLKCLKFGTPKYLLWCLGMNDSATNYKNTLDTLVGLCETKGIKLILCKIPTVPERNKETINGYIDDTNLRFIDFYSAMGTNSSGEWYNGYLNSTDLLHPTALGAQVQAMQVLVDFPEIMQYGLVVNSELNTV